MLLEGRTIGLIEDDPIMGESLVQSLSLVGCKVHWWSRLSEARSAVMKVQPDLVVCDVRLPDGHGGSFFQELTANSPLPPFLFMTAYGTIDEAVGLVRSGAGDYVTKPFEMEEFISRASALLANAPPAKFDCPLGSSEAMRRIEAMLRRVATRRIPVLILGGTGAGKEVCARRLHDLSAGAGRPFVAVNCAAVPPELMESEMFGHEKGAFSGATALHRGYAERAGDGTLFLDEIGDMPLAMQAKLLRLIEEREFTRVGGEKAIPFKARTVCATNVDLAGLVALGRFREDLYYRINVVAVEVPPLAGRGDDIRLLARKFIDEYAAEVGGKPMQLDIGAEQALVAHPWPGNVRELRNRIERAVMMASSSILHAADLFPGVPAPSDTGVKTGSLRAIREDAERRQIERVIAETGGNLGDAARLLQVSRTTLWEKIKRYEIITTDDA
jgi:DNA-binding NtrC family response regulator